MKIKLRLNKETEESIKNELEQKRIEISEDASLTLTEDDYHAGKLTCKDDGDIVIVAMEDICYIESIGKEVWVNTLTRKYKTALRIYQLDQILPAKDFIRISNSIIIQRNSIKRIKPALSCKFYLTLKTNDTVDVTRTYYYKFKEFYGI